MLYLYLSLFIIPTILCFTVARYRGAHTGWWTFFGLVFAPVSFLFPLVIPNTNRQIQIIKELKLDLSNLLVKGYAADEKEIIVGPIGQNGYMVKLNIDQIQGGFNIQMGNLKAHYKDSSVTSAVFLAAVTGNARMKVTKLGGRECIWNMEYLYDDKWKLGKPRKINLLYPFWKKREIVYRINTNAVYT